MKKRGRERGKEGERRKVREEGERRDGGKKTPDFNPSLHFYNSACRSGNNSIKPLSKHCPVKQDNPNQMGVYCPCFFTMLPEFPQTRVYQTSFRDVRKINFIFIFT